MMIRTIALGALALSAGCRPYTQAQLHLTEQARKGVTLAASSLDARAEQARQIHDLRRRRLDDAFDQDVRETAPLTPDWVIEHRKAYGVGLDALARQQSAAADALDTDRRNLRATDDALAKLKWLQDIELEWTIPFPATPSPTPEGSR